MDLLSEVYMDSVTPRATVPTETMWPWNIETLGNKSQSQYNYLMSYN